MSSTSDIEFEVLIKLKVKNQEIELNYDEAKKLYDSLNNIFQKYSYIPHFQPYFYSSTGKNRDYSIEIS